MCNAGANYQQLVEPLYSAWETILTKSHQFPTLDVLRGIAAIVVVQFHTWWLVRVQFARHGYLAVDFFFMLSGFVLTHAYQTRLDANWPLASFLKVRFIRLYPLYLLGLLLGLLFRLLANHYGQSGVTVSAVSVAIITLLGLLLIPAPIQFPGGNPEMFLLNGPAWSLFYEMLGNLGHALFLRRINTVKLSAFVAAAAVALAGCAARYGDMNFGAFRVHTWIAVSRIAFAYPTGILLYRIWQKGISFPKVPQIICAGILVLLLTGPAVNRPWVYDLFTTLVIFPCLLLLAANAQPGVLARAFQALGSASYAIYVLHAPLGDLFAQTWRHVTGKAPIEQAPWPGILYIAGLLVFAWVSDRVYDIPVRRYLRHALTQRTNSSPPRSSAETAGSYNDCPS